jgi:hypothetical protein
MEFCLTIMVHKSNLTKGLRRAGHGADDPWEPLVIALLLCKVRQSYPKKVFKKAQETLSAEIPLFPRRETHE